MESAVADDDDALSPRRRRRQRAGRAAAPVTMDRVGFSDGLAAAVGRGELLIDDVELASHQFLGLFQVEILNRRLFDPSATAPASSRKRIVDAAVAMFMRAYRP